MKELYKNMFTESNKNVKFDFNEKDFTSNIIDNPFKNFDKNNLQKNNNNLSLESELFRDKFSKAKTKRTLRNLSSLNIGSNTNDNFSYANFNKNDNTNNSNMNFNTNETKDIYRQESVLISNNKNTYIKSFVQIPINYIIISTKDIFIILSIKWKLVFLINYIKMLSKLILDFV